MATRNISGLKRGNNRKGKPNKVTTTLRDAILQAAEAVGGDAKGKEGLVGYLKKQATDEPVAFMNMLGKTLPTKVEGEVNGAFTVTWQLPHKS